MSRWIQSWSGAAWTGGQYSLFRLFFGLYLMVHLGALIPWGGEMFSSAGVLPKASDSPLIGIFPNVLGWVDSPLAITGLLTAGLVLAACFAVGFKDRAAAVVLWYLWACLFGRNPLISNPSLPYVGWMLLAHALIPKTPFLAWDARRRADPGGGWAMPAVLFGGCWLLMAGGYTFSGITKLVSPSWVDGTALIRVLSSPLARPSLWTELMLKLPEPALRGLTWVLLLWEVLFLPAALIPKLRPFVWLGMLGMHFGIIAFVDFADLTMGMVILHFFTFDPAWLARRPLPPSSPIFYAPHSAAAHALLRLLLAENPSAPLVFAPLDGDTCAEKLKERPANAELAVVLPGEAPINSEALIRLGESLGGYFRGIALLARLLPRPLQSALFGAGWRVLNGALPKPEQARPLIPDWAVEQFKP